MCPDCELPRMFLSTSLVTDCADDEIVAEESSSGEDYDEPSASDDFKHPSASSESESFHDSEDSDDSDDDEVFTHPLLLALL